ncbi:MAG: hypothetical protein OEM01_10090 [Desulfobulbaceae bacterium]|nr:hypothetical protein [Desulfobulbaceae bacterium]
MRCSGSEHCPARLFPDVPCWEIAEIIGANATVIDVCQDCIVYIVKANEPILTENELVKIFEFRKAKRLVGNCPAYENRLLTEKETAM